MKPRTRAALVGLMLILALLAGLAWWMTTRPGATTDPTPDRASAPALAPAPRSRPSAPGRPASATPPAGRLDMPEPPADLAEVEREPTPLDRALVDEGLYRVRCRLAEPLTVPTVRPASVVGTDPQALIAASVVDGVVTALVSAPDGALDLREGWTGRRFARIHWTAAHAGEISPCVAEETTTIEISGTVVNADDQPVAGMLIRSCPPGNLTTSAADGGWTVTVPTWRTCDLAAVQELGERFGIGPFTYVEVEDRHIEGVVLHAPDEDSLQSVQAQMDRMALLADLLRPELQARTQRQAGPLQAVRDAQGLSDAERAQVRAWLEGLAADQADDLQDLERLAEGNANPEDYREVWLYGFPPR